MPRGKRNPSRKETRIKADRKKQVPTNSYGPPEYYHDTQVRCRDCKAEFIFTAAEQQAWYEEYGIPHFATRVRCEFCAKKHKAHAILKGDYDIACATAKNTDAGYDDFLAAGIMAVLCAEEGIGRFDAPRNIGWLRKCLALRPTSREPLYLLARSYELSGMTTKALEKYHEFLNRTMEVKKGQLKMWRGLVEKRVARLSR